MFQTSQFHPETSAGIFMAVIAGDPVENGKKENGGPRDLRPIRFASISVFSAAEKPNETTAAVVQ
jgi:hypothetical protein